MYSSILRYVCSIKLKILYFILSTFLSFGIIIAFHAISPQTWFLKYLDCDVIDYCTRHRSQIIIVIIFLKTLIRFQCFDAIIYYSAIRDFEINRLCKDQII